MAVTASSEGWPRTNDLNTWTRGGTENMSIRKRTHRNIQIPNKREMLFCQQLNENYLQPHSVLWKYSREISKARWPFSYLGHLAWPAKTDILTRERRHNKTLVYHPPEQHSSSTLRYLISWMSACYTDIFTIGIHYSQSEYWILWLLIKAH